jgi:hypothetical protein
MRIKYITVAILLMVVTLQVSAQTRERWSTGKAKKWYAAHAWINGANFIPSTAINQLEMWQSDSFDPSTIDRELGWAEGLGFNTMRVYLHSLAYKQDPKGFIGRMGQYLAIADKHHIQTIFVFFDDCWNKMGFIGKQPAPQTGIHNSGWVQDPGDPAYKETGNYPALEKYVKDVMGTFARDKRILLWDLYNEPGNSGKLESSLPLLTKVFEWARSINSDQPISAGLWRWDFEKLNAVQIMNSDVITYHDYEAPEWHKRVLQVLKTHDRPLICTEYMARTKNSTFANTLPMLKAENIGAINWGLVAGKTNTIYAWDTPLKDGSQPAAWFHDIFWPDGRIYRTEETDLIKKLNNK